MFKFLHTADLHIDSPLRQLAAYDGAPVEALRAATREAFANLVSLALRESVDFVVIAGDLFDGKWEDMRTGLWTANQFRRLERQRIPVYMLRGNHDAASRVRTTVTWPTNVHEFPVRGPDTLRMERLGVSLHGQGFAHAECQTDLAASYPPADADCFNIGVLHTSLTGNSDHDTYAPTSVDVLLARGYDYWALGHIHQRSDPPLRTAPWIGYSGNAQGRHIRETGAKGCLLVTVDGREVASVDFQPTDVARWHLEEIQLEPDDTLADVIARTSERLEACHAADEGRLSVVRVVLRGACRAHRRLVDAAEREQLLAELRNRANALDGEVWLEKLLVATSPAVDWDSLRAGQDLLGDLLRDADRLALDDAGLAELRGALRPLWDKAPAELKDAGLELDHADLLRGWLDEAKKLLVARLWESRS